MLYFSGKCPDFRYGPNCSLKCGNCLDYLPCNKSNGHCSDCPLGLQPPFCRSACQNQTYGPNCNQSCGHCLGASDCNPLSGECVFGCAPGYVLSALCTNECDDGWFGKSCSQKCPPCVDGAPCSKTTGFCLNCSLNQHRPDCFKVALSKTEHRRSSEGYAYAGAIFAGCAIVGALLTIGYLMRKKSGTHGVRTHYNPMRDDKPGIPLFVNRDDPERAAWECDNSHTDRKPAGQRSAVSWDLNDAKELAKQESWSDVKDDFNKDVDNYNFDDSELANERVIPLETYFEVIKGKLRNGFLPREFTKLALQETDGTITSGQKKENYYKNRYTCVFPYDTTRVILAKDRGNEKSDDYINANFIKGARNERAYIAAQGPRENTVNDFWLMIWQEGVTDIVMLTNVTEGKKLRCEKYWPPKSKELIAGDIFVTTLGEKMRAFFVIRTFQVEKSKVIETRRVTQYQYVSWKTHKVPSTTPLVDFWRYVRARRPRENTASPLLVHGCAGVGRTGTYIALDVLMDQAEDQNKVDIYTCVQHLREDRCRMVQNKGQYEFLHEAFLEAYASRHTRITKELFEKQFPQDIKHEAADKIIDSEFETLCILRGCPVPSKTITTNLGWLKTTIIPGLVSDDSSLLTSSSEVNQGINAVYIPTFFNPRGCILTQLPQPDTVIDMWRMIDVCDVNTVVSIGNVDELRRYWPESEEPLHTGDYTIKLISRKAIGETLSSYNLTLTKENKSQSVNVLHLRSMSGRLADSVADLIHLLVLLHTCQVNHPASPVIIQCIDGASYSGMVCALWGVISRVTSDGEVDVYHAVTHVKISRPKAVSSLEQYRFCFTMVQHYLSKNTLPAITTGKKN